MSGFLDGLKAYRSRAGVEPWTADDEPSTLSETIEAAFSLTRREELSNSAMRAWRQKNDQRAQTIAELGGNQQLAAEYALLPQNFVKTLREAALEGRLESHPFYRSIGPRGQAAFNEVLEFERRYPGRVPSDQALLEEFKAEAAELRTGEQFAIERGGFFGQLVGTGAAVMTDPMVLATLPAGATGGAGRSLLGVFGRTAAIEGSVAAAVEIPIQAQVAQFKRDIEAPWTLRDSALNVLAAGAGGALLGGAIGTGVEGSRRALARYRAAKKAGRVVETEEMAEAERILEALEQVDEQNPLRLNEEPASAVHEDALDIAQQQAQRGEAVDVRSVVEEFEPADGMNRTITRAEDPGELVDIDPAEIDVDARTFQFKGGADDAGVTDALKDVRQFDRRLAGVSLIWERKDGRQFIADGHQRRALALRAREAGQAADETMLNGFVMREVDGVTAGDARRVAAIKNMAEGTGSPIDAAKILRELGELGDAMLPPLPPRSALVRQARGLSKLDDDAFMQVVNGVIDERFGALVGDAASDPKLQQAMIEVLRKTQPANETQARSIVDQVRTAGTETVETEDLFGAQSITESLYLERAQVLDNALREARKDKAVFGRLVAEENRIQEAGRNELDRAANQQRIQEANDAQAKISRLANSKGPISDALTEAARRVKGGEKPADVAADFLDTARRAVLESNNGGGETRRARSGSEAAGDEARLDPVEGRPVRLDNLEQAERPRAARRFLAGQRGWSLGDLYKNAKTNQNRLARVGGAIAEDLGDDVELKNPGLKKRTEVKKKTTRKKYGTERVTDVVRIGFTARTDAASDAIVTRLADEFELLDEGLHYSGLGYLDHKVLVRFKNGQIGEVQIWEPNIAEAKFGRGTEISKALRDIPDEELAASPALKAQRQAMAEESMQLYAAALARADESYRRMAMMKLPEDMRARVQAAEASGTAGASGNRVTNTSAESSSPDSRISATEAGDQPSPGSATTRPSSPPEGRSRTAAGLNSQSKNRTAIDQPPRSIVRENAADPSESTRTGTVSDTDYRAVMERYQQLADDQGELLQVVREIDGELTQRSARQTINQLDDVELALEDIRLCNISREAAQ